MKRFFQYLFNVHDDDDDACNCRDCVNATREYNRDLLRDRIERTIYDHDLRVAQREWISSRNWRNMNGNTR